MGGGKPPFRTCNLISLSFENEVEWLMLWTSSVLVVTMSEVTISHYSFEHRTAIRQILEGIGWAEQYIVAAEQNAEIFSQDPSIYGVYVAMLEGSVVGFVYVRLHTWNQLAQIEGLAVDVSHQRKGIASELVEKAETFAHEKGARGIYVDTPTLNRKGRGFYEAIGYNVGYEMPRYYEDNLDGVTYQRFFDNG